jgi:putative transposase
MRKTFIYKAKISKATEQNALNWLYLCRTLYNVCLEQRKIIWKRDRKCISGYDQANQLPELKQEFPEFKSVSSHTLQDVTERVQKAYGLFYSNLKSNPKTAGLPRFRSKDRYDSFTLKKNGWSLDGRYLHIKNVGTFKLFLSRPIEGDIKTITIKKDSCGDWFVSFSCKDVASPEYKPFEKDAVGLDVGISSFLTDSEGNQVDNPKFFRSAEVKLRKKQRKLSRRKKGSVNRNKAKKLAAKQHRKVKRQRLDFLFKTAKKYVEKYALIAIEKLKISSMLKNNTLAKSISDASWSKFKEILIFKAEEAGRLVELVNPAYTSQDCSGCGKRVKKELSERTHDCKSCGLILDRDHNAAINILKSAVGQIACKLTCGTSQSVLQESPL